MSRLFAVAGIQARMSSSRLPGKSLADVAGVPLIQRVVDRARAALRLDAVVVLTSSEASDDPLADYCEGADIPLRRGPLLDVYARYAALADELEPRYLVRITGDCPLLAPGHVDLQLEALEAYDADFAPADSAAEHVFAGQGALSTRALRAAAASDDPRDREHVGSFFFKRHADRFRSVRVRVDPELVRLAPGLRLCVDEAADLELVRRVFERFAPRHGSLVPITQVVAWLAGEGAVRALNAGVADSADNQSARELGVQAGPPLVVGEWPR